MLFFVPSAIVVFGIFFGIVKVCEWVNSHPAIANMNIFVLLGIIVSIPLAIGFIAAAIASCRHDDRNENNNKKSDF